jgi:hypothetical protein
MMNSDRKRRLERLENVEATTKRVLPVVEKFTHERWIATGVMRAHPPVEFY